MKTLIVLIASAALTLVQASAVAQLKKPGILLGANFLYNSPKGNLADSYNNGLGAEAMGGIGLGKTYLTASYGSFRFLSKPGSKDMIVKPLKFGIRQFIIGKNVFISADAGNASVHDKTKDMTNSNFIGTVGAGVRLAGLEAGLYYNTLGGGSNASYHFMQYKLGWGIVL